MHKPTAKMKTTSMIFAAILSVAASSAFAAEARTTDVIPAGMVNWIRLDPVTAAQFYADLTGMRLVTSSHVTCLTNRITLQPREAMKVSKMTKLVEKALREQAGVVLTKLDEKRLSVTHNDALSINGGGNGK
jgi:hypothetical protein